jgi:hypothetical protein
MDLRAQIESSRNPSWRCCWALLCRSPAMEVKASWNRSNMHLNLGSAMQESLRIVQTATRKIGSKARLIAAWSKSIAQFG